MKHKSPAKTLRDVVRMTRFLNKKNQFKSGCGLSFKKLASCDIPPVPVTKPVLSIQQVQTTTVCPRLKPKLSISRQISIDIPPDQETKKNVPKPFTMVDFMDIVQKSENVSKQEVRDKQKEREKDLLEFNEVWGFHPDRIIM